MLLMFPNSRYLFPCTVFSWYQQGFKLRFIFVSMQIFPIRSFYIDMQGSAHLNSLFRPMFAFKSTIFCHFAGYASVALVTIWLYGPRDLGFSESLMA